MTTITKERLLTIKQWRETYGPGSNVVLPAEEAEELARIALASLEAEPVAWTDEEELRDVRKYGFGEIFQCPPDKYADSRRVIPLYRELPAQVVPEEIAETSTNYPLIPGEVLSAIQKVAKIRADFDDFDGDRRGIGDCLDEAEQELIVTINKYASQLAAEPIAPNDVREQTAIPQVPVTPDGWISCSERMPNDAQWCVVNTEYGYYVQCWSEGQGWLGDDISIPECDVINWMPLPEPPQEVNRG